VAKKSNKKRSDGYYKSQITLEDGTQYDYDVRRFAARGIDTVAMERYMNPDNIGVFF
jgi:hypothetical protein